MDPRWTPGGRFFKIVWTWADLGGPGWTSVGTSVWQPCPLLEPPSGRLQARPGQAQAGSSLRVAQNHGFPMPTHAKTKNSYGCQQEVHDYPLDSIGSWWDPTRFCWGWGGNVPPRKWKSVHRQSVPDIPRESIIICKSITTIL